MLGGHDGAVVAIGVVRVWRRDDGWGVVDAEETPGGCWVHVSAVRASVHRELRAGQQVRFAFEAVQQDGYDYRAEWAEVLDEGRPGA